MSAIKVLACGSVNGKFSKFFKKISSIQKKNGPFEMVICTGDFFSAKPECKEDWEAFKKKKENINLPVYLLGPTSPKLESFYEVDGKIEDGCELCEDVIYLGKKGIFKTSSGLAIAYLSGSESTNSCGVKKSHVNSLIEQVKKDDKYSGVDILITTTWPKDVTKHTSSKIVGDGSSMWLSLLAATLKPRYHLSCHKTKFFERTPYRNHKVLNEQLKLVTRFISLAPFNNPEGEKALYALSMSPLSSMTSTDVVKQPELVTEFPYKEVIDSILSGAGSDDQPQQFFFDSNKKRKHGDDDGRSAKKTPKGPPVLKSDCWFCLGSKDVEKHLVVSVGEHCYVAIAKGAINKDHLLICPVNHYNSTVVSPDTVVMEMEKYKLCLRKMFFEEGKEVVTYERNFYTQHLQLQVIGVPSECAGEVKETFFDLAEESNMDLMPVDEEKDIADLVAVTTPYFAVELPSEETLLHKVKGKMPLQFGRDVLTSPSILNLPDRGDWKACKLEKDEEVAMAKKFRKRFQPFDFNFT